MRISRVSFLLVPILLLAGQSWADDDGGKTKATDGASGRVHREVKGRTGRGAADGSIACAHLNEVMLRRILDIEEGTEITLKPSNYSPNPLCTATWPKPNAEELQRQQSEKMSAYIHRKARGEDVKVPIVQTSDRASLTLSRRAAKSPDQAMANFDSAMKRLSDGITGSHQGVSVTIQSNLVAVDGVGDKAMWSAKMHQLSVVTGVEIFHVSVNTGADDAVDMALAKQLASEIIASL